MKRLSLLFTFFVLLTAFTCEDEPLDQDILDNQDTNTSCEQASLNTAAAALAFINQFEDGGDYTELCNAYKEALEDQIEACGDPDGAIQQAIDALGDCIDPEDFTDCQAAENAVNLAQINFENATDENYNDLCVIYKTTLENQITECGDEDGSLQAIIDGLGDCSNDSQPDDCETVTEDASIAQTAFGNATDENYEELCNAYKEALQVQISVCGDADGSLQQLVDELGDCVISTTTYEIGDIGPGGGFVFYLFPDGGGLEIAPEETEFLTQWGCYSMYVAGTLSEVGSGQANTNTILDFHNSIDFYNNPEQCQQFVNPVGVIQSTGDVAAKKCDDLVFGGKDDWYLPSIGELSLVYDNLVSQGLGDIDSGGFCSSTDDEQELRMWVIFWEDGNATTSWKYDLWYYRAIRSF